MELLKKEFDAAMRDIYFQAKKKKCHSNRFIQMVEDKGGFETARELLQKHDTTGFTRLWEIGCLSLSLEALVISEKYKSLFSPDEIKICQERLHKYGYNYKPC